MLDVPVAYAFFNRPDSVLNSFDHIRAARPTRLFLISDGARPDRAGEADLVTACREIVEQVDWKCDVTQIYAETNLGCGNRISSAISKAFESVDRLIVLEDDCIADPSFFSYCDELLDRYQDDRRIMAISGNNFQHGNRRGDASYYFSKHPHCWGWATWKRAWQHFDLSIPTWPAFRDQGGLASFCDSDHEALYWTKIFDKVHTGQGQSWAFPWTLACWMQHGLTVLPQVNLVSNVGFGDDATHTRRKNSVSNLPIHSLEQLIHPKWVSRNIQADRFTDDHVFSGIGRRGTLKRIETAIRSLRKAA